MDERLIEELVDIVEAYINELEDDTVERTGEKRKQNFLNAIKKVNAIEPELYKAAVNGDKEKTDKLKKEKEEAIADRDKAEKKLGKFKENDFKRRERKWDQKEKIESFRNKLMNMQPSAKAMKKAGAEQLNAMLNQGLRNKLEKSLGKVSESCFEEILSIVDSMLSE